MLTSRLLALTALPLAACAVDPGPPPGVPSPIATPLVTAPVPEVPAIDATARPVHLMEADAFLRPSIPPYRTSSDGRLALGLTKEAGQVAFRLFGPEALTGHWSEEPAGVVGLVGGRTLSLLAPYYAYPYVHPLPFNLSTTDHRTLCDAWPVASPVANPYPCTDNLAQDCYDVTVVSTFRIDGTHTQLHGKPIRVRVDNPKTASATIAAVETSPPGAPPVAVGPVLRADFGLEPMITSDGHLLVMRIGDTVTTNPVTGTASDRIDIVYLVSDPSELACDVTAWTEWLPVTHAPFDTANAMPARYGFAAYPFRDGKGVAFDDGEDLGGSYPWIDRLGRNLFFTVQSSTLWHVDGAGALAQRYADHCVDDPVTGNPLPCTDPASVAALYALGNDLENDEQFRGFAFAGLWSRGKTVLVDGIINNLDYGLGRSDLEQRTLDLYATGGPVRVGTGRDNGGSVPTGAVDNTTFLDSWEHLFNHDDRARPATLRDVVWLINTGKASMELAFDDYLDGDALILSDGTAATTQAHPWASTNQPTMLDGFVQTASRTATYTGLAELANAATPIATRWPIAPSGVLEGAMRIEPVALGGIEGKGVWLAGAGQAIRYDIPAPPAGVVPPSKRTISLFVDPRPLAPGPQALLTFPDGTQVDLVDLSHLRYQRNGFGTTIAMPALVPHAWNHLAWVVTADGNTITLFRDGYPAHQLTLPGGRKMFAVAAAAASTLRIGGRPGATSFRGWIDDLKVFARALDLEHVCNLGRGTLAQLAAGSPFTAQAALYTTHAGVAAALGVAPGASYVCVHDYVHPERSVAGDIVAPDVALRAEVLFPEGPLHAASPRPDSSANKFCLGCHVADGVAPPSLQPAALVVDPALAAQDDPRRQPMQTPARIFGNVPLDYFLQASPGSLANGELDAPADGEPIDPYVIP